MRLFLFNRGLRLQDNTTLIRMTRTNQAPVIPIFIFTPEQIDSQSNDYFCDNAVAFMMETLREMDEELRRVHKTRLYYFKGDVLDILKKLDGTVEHIQELGFNRDYTPYARNREMRIIDFCRSHRIDVTADEDLLLHPLMDSTTLKADGTPYKVFTPYKNHVMKIPVRPVDNAVLKPGTAPNGLMDKLMRISFKGEVEYINHGSRLIKGGRQNALKILNNLQAFSGYKKDRDFLHKRTTLLSAYLSFGVLSIREVYWRIVDLFGRDHALVTELIWRDFYTMIQYHFPYVIRANFKSRFDRMKWEDDPSLFQKWKTGTTGYPCVDAGMRQLLKEGFMANRSRMITSSFLVKHMLINWKHGERHFARHLTDVYFPSNNGGWQWTFGGVDPSWYRIFNPLSQGKKYDLECKYIKMYVPELKNVPPEHIHKWDVYHIKYKGIVDYPPPCLNLKKRREMFFMRVKSL